MTWRDELRPASFRGVPFHVESSDFAGGRRGENHEYALRDESYFEDLGRKARKFTLSGFVIGADYMRARDALIDALETSGPGQLVHPFYGSRNVAVPEFRASESKTEGGLARFTITFEETGESTQPIAADDRTAQVKSAANVFDLAAIEGFADRFLSSGFPEFVVSGSLDIADTVASALLSAAGSASFADDVSDFLSSASTLISKAEDFAARIIALISGLGGSGADPVATLDTLSVISEDDYMTDVPRETSSRAQEVVNVSATAAVVRRAAMSAKARYLADADFVSVSEANAAMEIFTDAMDSEVEKNNVSDTEYSAARSLTAKVVSDLSARLGGLPRVRSISVPNATPALVLAYSLYENPERDSEIVARNDLVRPGFVPSGRDIEVLSE